MKTALAFVFVLCLILVVQASEFKLFRDCLNKCKKETLQFRFCAKYCYRGKPADVDAALDYALSDQDFGTTFSKDKLWSQLRAEILGKFTMHTKSPTLRMTTQLYNAAGFDNDVTLSKFCDLVPVAGPVHTVKMASFRERYKEFLYAIDAPTLTPSALSKTLSVEAYEMGKELRKQDKECLSEWNSLDQREQKELGNPNGYESFRAVYCTLYQQQEAEYNMKYSNYLQSLRADYGNFAELQAAIQAYEKSKLQPPTYSTLSSIAKFKTACAEGKTNSFSFEVTRNTQTETNSWDRFSFSIGVPLPSVDGTPKVKGLDFSSGGEIALTFGSNKTVLTTKTSEWKMGFAVKGYEYFPVLADSTWFKADVISKYMNMKYKSGYSKDYFFSLSKDTGIPLLLKGFYLVYKPSITLFVSQKDSSDIKEASKFGLDLTYGPIHISASSDKGCEVKQVDGQTYSVTLSSNSEDIQIWAADVEILDQDMKASFEAVSKA